MCVGLNIGWLSNNMAPHYKRATSLGFTQSVGSTAGIVAGLIYPKTDAPGYKLGHYFSMICAVIAAVIYLATFAYLKIKNHQKQKRLDNHNHNPDADGDDSDEFFYIY